MVLFTILVTFIIIFILVLLIVIIIIIVFFFRFYFLTVYALTISFGSWHNQAFGDLNINITLIQIWMLRSSDQDSGV